MTATKSELPKLSGLSLAVLPEILQSLSEFTTTHAEKTIDLRGLPMTNNDLNDLDARLGIGEVIATLAVTGRSEIWETTFAGVWRVRHYGSGDDILADEIVISSIPKILHAHADDIGRAGLRLRETVDEIVQLTNIEKGKAHE